MNILTILFSHSFLFSMIVFAILIGCIFAYLRYKIIEQDHKINSMFSLVSSMVDEVSFLRNQILPDVRTRGGSISKNTIKDELIVVSDEEDNEDRDDDEDDDEDFDNDNDLDADSVDDSESEDDNDMVDNPKISLFNFNLGNTYSILQKEIVDISEKEETESVDSEPLEHDIDDDLSVNDEQEEPNVLQSFTKKETKTVHLEEVIELPVNTSDVIELSNNNENSMDFLKSITIQDLQENVDYKKLTLQKLRSMVVEKGIVQDASKLKKTDILKMLEVE